jgi:uncharacterized protein VirK/YbjX
LNERNLQPGEEPLDADLVFAASGCAYAAQRSLERELQWAGQPDPVVTGRREISAKEGQPGSMVWWRSLRGRTDWTGHAAKRALMAAKYVVRTLGMPSRHNDFLAFLDSHPLLRANVGRDPRLQERHHHRFVNSHWHRRDRLSALMSHYRLLLERWPDTLFEAVYVQGGAMLGALTLKNGSKLQLHLRAPAFMNCEGELSIELSDDDGCTLYRAVVTVVDEDTLAIGCMQGPGGVLARERVRELTRQMHGMRPKQLLLVLAYAFAGQFGLHRIVAVGNDAHPLKGRARLFSDYDSYWIEQGGVLTSGGWFVLPPTLHHRTEQETESKRRALFRRRADLRWEAVQLLNDVMRPVPWWRHMAEVPAAIESLSPLPEGIRAA